MDTARKPQPQQPQRQPVDRRRVADALAEIARDVRQDPQGYLERTRSPGGGE